MFAILKMVFDIRQWNDLMKNKPIRAIHFLIVY